MATRERLIRLAIRVDRSRSELVLAELLELAPSGVEEVDVSDDVVEYAVYGPPGELPELPDIHAAAGGALVQVSTTEVADDWSDRWREFHKPLVLDGKLTVRPPWDAPATTPLEVIIDPAQAFGTGAHATTRLCLELLLEAEPNTPLLDLGCGSGVLAIAAAKLGFDPVTAVDFDPLSVEATEDNARVNGVQLAVARVDVRSDPIPDAPLVLANLLAPLHRTWISRMSGSDAPLPRTVIASGLLAEEADELAADFADRTGLRERERRTNAGWAALRLERTP